MKTLSLKLPDALGAKLELVARERGTSKSEIIRQALVDYFSRGDRGAAGSFLALAEDLAGCVKGPRDLSVNKDHLLGYGQ